MSRAIRALRSATAIGFMLAASVAGMSDARGTLKDPTRPPDVSEVGDFLSNNEKDPTFVLSAILVAEGRQIAVINGEPVQVGDQVKHATVVRIMSDRVVLEEASGEVTLRLVSSSIRSTEGAKE